MIFNSFIKSDFITAVFLLILSLVAFAKYLYKERLFELVSIFFTKRYLVHFRKDSNLIFNRFNAILFSVLLLTFALFLYVLGKLYFPDVLEENIPLAILKILGFLGLFFLIRFLVGLLLATLFQLNKLHQSIVFTKITSLFAISILILPLLIIVIYIEKFNLLIFQLTLFILGILLITRYVFVVRNNKNMVSGGLFYFILYLCALEIAPLLLILKLIN